MHQRKVRFWLETPGVSSAGMGGMFEARIREADAGELRIRGATWNGPVAVREGRDREIPAVETGPTGLPREGSGEGPSRTPPPKADSRQGSKASTPGPTKPGPPTLEGCVF